MVAIPYLLLNVAGLPFPIAGSNHQYERNYRGSGFHIRQEVRDYTMELRYALQSQQHNDVLYLNKGLLGLAQALRMDLSLHFTWHCGSSGYHKWDWDGLAKRPQDFIIKDFLGIDDGYVVSALSSKDKQEPASFDLAIYVLWTGTTYERRQGTRTALATSPSGSQGTSVQRTRSTKRLLPANTVSLATRSRNS